MDIAETLDVCDEARANTPWWRWRKPALELTAPQVLGVHGRFIPASVSDAPDAQYGVIEGRPVYGYSRRQCRQIQKVILAAARSDAGLG